MAKPAGKARTRKEEQQAAIQAQAAAIEEFKTQLHPDDLNGGPIDLRAWIKRCDTCDQSDLQDMERFVSGNLQTASSDSPRDRLYRAMRGPFAGYAKAALQRRFGLAGHG